MVGNADSRPSADVMLDRVRQQAGLGARGRHRVYLGIAPGVSKTYTALEELHRRKERSTDVVIGPLETHGGLRTAELASSLDVVPRKQIPYKGVVVEEMDTDAVIQRHPAIALVDELAHTDMSPHALRQRMRHGNIRASDESVSEESDRGDVQAANDLLVTINSDMWDG
jgi:two-component system sensor histidine kinase KdpD